MDNERGNVDVERRRKVLFSCLEHVLSVSLKKFDSDHTSNNEKRSWARIIISSIQAYGDLLESSQLDELESRLELLESKELVKDDLFNHNQAREVKVYG